MEVLTGFEIYLTPKSCAPKTEPSLHALVPILINYGRSLFSAIFPKMFQELIDHFTRNPPSQNLDKDLHKSARSYTSKTRYVQRKFFVRWLANEESVTRDWLVYSPSTGNVYCYVCKLFRSDSFSLNGFNDWENAHRITTHERSDSHLVAVKKGFENAKAHHVDSAIAKQL